MEDIPVEKLIMPKEYVDAAEGHDIALIKLCTEVEISKKRKHIKTICLPVEESQYIENLEEDDRVLTVAGWGQTEHNTDTINDVLLKTHVPFMPNAECGDKFKRVLYSNDGRTRKSVVVRDIQMCAGGIGRNDSCKGDSGSGLIGFATLNTKTRMFQHGIVSFGIDCQSKKSLPAVYTRVSKFIGWILDNISRD